jgi:hypothetical protein
MAVICVRAESQKGANPTNSPCTFARMIRSATAFEVAKVADLDDLYCHADGARRGRQWRNLDCAWRALYSSTETGDRREARWKDRRRGL